MIATVDGAPHPASRLVALAAGIAGRFRAGLAGCGRRIDDHGRLVAAGRDTARLLRQSDAGLARLGLRRDTVAMAVFARHGIALNDTGRRRRTDSKPTARRV